MIHLITTITVTDIAIVQLFHSMTLKMKHVWNHALMALIYLYYTVKVAILHALLVLELPLIAIYAPEGYICKVSIVLRSATLATCPIQIVAVSVVEAHVELVLRSVQTLQQ